MGQPIIMAKFITEPNHSIIKQSNHAIEDKLQLNGDGFGVAWYVKDVSPYPSVFTETTPAWSNANLKELAKLTRSSCILTHVRQASEGSPVVQTNCHPFSHKKFSFMHNGYVEHFPLFKRSIVNLLSDEVYHNVQGTTDSEHLFALYMEFYKQMKPNYTKEKRLELMEAVMCKVITTVKGFGVDLKKKQPEKYVNEDFTDSLNLVVSDGDRIVATRYTSGPPKGAHTMFYCTGKDFHCHPGGDTKVLKNSDVEVTEHNQVEEHEKMVIIASEPLTEGYDFKEIPPNYMIIADRSTICLKSVEKVCEEV